MIKSAIMVRMIMGKIGSKQAQKNKGATQVQPSK
jgi:hypothetical protein